MSTDNEWVEDVKRWCHGTAKAAADGEPRAVENTDFALGYEAAHPALQARHWPDADAFESSTA